MRFTKLLRGFGLAWLLLLVVSFVFAPILHAADDFGRDPYGTCTYGACNAHTVAQTPSGLKVAVNLTDGQVIPRDGYTITVTPLNGSGSSFKTVDIYIDGVKIATITPGANGTGTWYWDPAVHPGSAVRLVVSDLSGKTTAFDFQVTIASVAAIAQGSGRSNGGTSSDKASGSVVARFFESSSEGAKRAIKALPAPVVYSFPYLLFALLLVEMMVLLLQTKRELSARRVAEEQAEQEREIAGMKQTLVQLVSHYLRTPLTILQGGAEELSRDGVPAETVTGLRASIKQLHDTVEALIRQATQAGAVVSGGADAVSTSARGRAKAVGYIAIWLPVALVGLLAFGFVYLANDVSRFTTNTIGVLTQVAVYSILTIVLYQVIRRWQLHRRDTATARKLLQEEQAIQAMRDTLVTQSAAQLQSQVGSLSSLAKTIPATASNAKFVSRGVSQLEAATNKFVIATHLKGARSPDSYAPTSIQALYARVEPGVKSAIDAKQLTVVLPTVDHVFSVQNSGLLILVLKSLIDNAVAYSNEKGTIEVGVAVSPTDATITVTDQGSGISPEKQSALFQPFFKAEGAEQFNREGMGFSLYLDKLIMAYLGGTISLASEPGTQTIATIVWRTKTT